MMRKMTALLLFLSLTALLPAQVRQTAGPNTLVFTHVTVIDATGAPAKPDLAVVITGDHITALDKTERIVPPKGARVVDAKGKFIIPGLWDMHVHTSHKNFLTLFIANGITSVRDMGGSPKEFDRFIEWRREMTSGVR